MKYLILTITLLSSLSALSSDVICSGNGYGFNTNGDIGKIITPQHSFDISVLKTGANYSGTIGEAGFFAYRFILNGNKGELKLIGRNNIVQELDCVTR